MRSLDRAEHRCPHLPPGGILGLMAANARPGGRSAIDPYFPDPATATRQTAVVNAAPDVAFDAILNADLAASPPIRALTTIRASPDRFLRRLKRLPPQPAPRRTIAGLIEGDWWLCLTDQPPADLVLGLVMWDPEAARDGLIRARFEDPATGSVRVGWSLAVEPLGGDRCRIVTETRTRPIGERAGRRFRRYWAVIGPFANLTRRLVLRRIAADAERRAEIRKSIREPGTPTMVNV
jgi:hypothetical protein